MSVGKRQKARLLYTVLPFACLLSSLQSSAVPQPDDVATSRAATGILEKQCLSCNGASQTSGLDMRHRETLLRGGKRGPAIIAGNPDGSLLYQSVLHKG